MGFLDAFKSLLGGGQSKAGGDSAVDDGVYYYVKCAKCGEVIRIRANRRNDFNREEDGPTSLLLRKEIMGSKRCFELIHAALWVDSNYQVVSADIAGGSLASAEDYEIQEGITEEN